MLSFLGRGKYQAILIRDRQEDAAAVKIEAATLSQKDKISAELRAGGGLIARFTEASGAGDVT